MTTVEGGSLPWRHRISLRVRIALVAAVVVAVVVTLGGVMILLALRGELLGVADDAVSARADEIAALVTEGTLPARLPAQRDPVTFAEVVADGRVVAATPGLGDRNRFHLPERAAGQADVSGVTRLPLAATGPYRVAARGVDSPDGPMTVFVAVSVRDVEHTVNVAAEIGAIGVVLLVLALAAVMWLALGRTLAPVEAIRVQADAIAGHTLDQRVPEPVQHDEIGRLARTVNRMLGRLERSADRQRRFVADAAHELRSPIASLRVLLESARDRGGVQGHEDDMLHETVRMEGLVDQLLLLARADADVPWLQASTVDLDDVVDEAVAGLGPAGRIGVDVSAVEPVQVSGDPGLLERLVANLVQNALAHAQETVRVSVSRGEGGQAVLAVDDDGPGVPEDRRDDIFGRFVRLDPSRERGRGGVGLGLAIVAEIVHAHGGTVEVGDAPGGGARFVVELPGSQPELVGTAEHPGR